MKKYAHFIVALIWCIYAVYDYYYGIYFFSIFIWLFLIIMMAVIFTVHLIKLILNRKNTTKVRTIKFTTYLTLFILQIFYLDVHEYFERIDTFLFLYQKKEIVEKVRQGVITPTERDNGNWTKLPSGYPQVSNPENEIIISKNEINNTLTVKFAIFSNFMEAPSIILFYTNDPEMIKILEEEINKNPEQNWKVEENWYRYFGEQY